MVRDVFAHLSHYLKTEVVSIAKLYPELHKLLIRFSKEIMTEIKNSTYHQLKQFFKQEKAFGVNENRLFYSEIEVNKGSDSEKGQNDSGNYGNGSDDDSDIRYSDSEENSELERESIVEPESKRGEDEIRRMFMKGIVPKLQEIKQERLLEAKIQKTKKNVDDL